MHPQVSNAQRKPKNVLKMTTTTGYKVAPTTTSVKAPKTTPTTRASSDCVDEASDASLYCSQTEAEEPLPTPRAAPRPRTNSHHQQHHQQHHHQQHHPHHHVPPTPKPRSGKLYGRTYTPYQPIVTLQHFYKRNQVYYPCCRNCAI